MCGCWRQTGVRKKFTWEVRVYGDYRGSTHLVTYKELPSRYGKEKTPMTQTGEM